MGTQLSLLHLPVTQHAASAPTPNEEGLKQGRQYSELGHPIPHQGAGMGEVVKERNLANIGSAY